MQNEKDSIAVTPSLQLVRMLPVCVRRLRQCHLANPVRAQLPVAAVTSAAASTASQRCTHLLTETAGTTLPQYPCLPPRQPGNKCSLTCCSPGSNPSRAMACNSHSYNRIETMGCTQLAGAVTVTAQHDSAEQPRSQSHAGQGSTSGSRTGPIQAALLRLTHPAQSPGRTQCGGAASDRETEGAAAPASLS